jgi:phenylalanyl-tRNA synthetase beta chain
MRVPLGWLAEWIDLPDSQGDLCERLTLGGLEIEGVERSGPDLSGIRIGRVVECGKHPAADKLSLCRVETGDGEPLDIVCGAPNVASGQKVAVALPGAQLPDGTKIKKAKLRGVVSHGMICSERELGLGDAHEGILVLPPDAPVGAPLSDAVAAGDVVLDLEITPNRGDWVSMLGIAREVRAHFGGELRLPPVDPPEAARRAAEDIRIEIEDGEGCYRYVGRVVRGVRVGSSPEWLQRRLETAGVRSINAIVDVTNLVMLEFGQPIHAFDLDTLRGEVIRVRRARGGETLRTLDGETRELGAEDLVIADAERAIAVAGVMGGAETEVRDDSVNLLIESAHFHPARVRKTARRLGLSTEASYRFERSVDRAGIQRAADRAARLIAELTGGEVSAGIVEATAGAPPITEEIRLDPARVNRLLGTDLSIDDVAALLERVDVAPVRAANGTLGCRIPSYRNDLHIPEDLIEEVARVHGYDRIPTTLPHGALVPVEPSRERVLIDAARDSLAGAGLIEVMTFPGMRLADLEALRLAADDARRQTVRVLNPLSEEESQLWTTAVPSLLRAAQLNLARQVEWVRIFHVGRVFVRSAKGELPTEPLRISALLTRPSHDGLWSRAPAPLFFEAKGVAERLTLDLGVDADFSAGAPEPYLHPGAANEIRVGDTRLGAVGELHPAVAAHFEIGLPCALIEVDLSGVAELPQRPASYREVSRQPRVRRDLAVLLDRGQPAAEVLEAIRKTAGAQLVALEIFDRYEGKGVPEGKVSLAFRLDFQRPDRTLKDAEVTKITDRVMQMLSQRFGGERR